MQKVYCLILVASLAFFSCKKKAPPVVEDDPQPNSEVRPGLPPDPNLINGYFYSGFKINGSSSNTYTSLNCFAAFADPARKLTSNFDPFTDNLTNSNNKNAANVQVGEITLNDIYTLNHSSFSNSAPPFIYNYFTNLFSSTFSQVSWKSEGNGSFRPVNVVLPITYPDLQFPVSLNTISRTSTVTINLKQVFPNGADSIIAALIDYGNSYGVVKKYATRADTVIRFVPSDMNIYGASSSANVQLMGLNYCHQVVNGKVHLFTLCSKYFKNVYLTP